MIVLANILPIISIIASLVALFLSVVFYLGQQQTNKINLNSLFHDKIFDEILLNKLPNAVFSISHLGGKFVDENHKLDDAIMELKKRIIFFKFKDESFYDSLFEQIITIDDFLVDYSDRSMNIDVFNRKCQQLEEKTQILYKIVEKHHLTGESK